ncbi:MAG: secA [Dehalococcoidia bacterium]|nr:secA [Dehalococcoidia bacterium]
MLKSLTKIFGDSNEAEIKKLRPLVVKVNALEPDVARLTDVELKARTDEFRRGLAGASEGLDKIMPEAFATVREMAKRRLGQRHYDAQLIGGAILHQGKVAEMRTGEGKTLVATLPAYLNALPGEGVHVVTVNDYLAKRDTQWMGPIYHDLGLTVACLQHDSAFLFDPVVSGEDERYRGLRPVRRQEAYAADITYGTNAEFGFDYLRDNMVVDLSARVQRPLSYAIVDEVDNILIDEARTPLIISGQSGESAQQYQACARIVPSLREGEDYEVDEKVRSVTLTQAGISKVEQRLGLLNLYDAANYLMTHYVDNALRAHAVYKKDVDYVVKNGEVLLVDEFTGRLMVGRRLSDGLHQAIEAKEGVRVQPETVTLATITLQNYFRLYGKLAG